MRYDVGVAESATASATNLFSMEIAYSTRPLTAEERLLVHRWLHDYVLMAGFVLLTMRLDHPKLSVEDIFDLPSIDRRAFLLGLAESVEADYKRQAALDRLDTLDTTICH